MKLEKIYEKIKKYLELIEEDDLEKKKVTKLNEKIEDKISKIKNSKDEIDVLAKAELLKEYLKSLDVIATGRIDILIREKRIDKKMATTLLNDSSHAYNVINKLISVAKILWIEDLTIKKLGEDYEAGKNL